MTGYEIIIHAGHFGRLHVLYHTFNLILKSYVLFIICAFQSIHFDSIVLNTGITYKSNFAFRND